VEGKNICHDRKPNGCVLELVNCGWASFEDALAARHFGAVSFADVIQAQKKLMAAWWAFCRCGYLCPRVVFIRNGRWLKKFTS